MTQTLETSLDRTVQKTQKWLNDILEATGREDQHVAYLMLRSVLHTIRDRLTVDETANFAAQLPLLVKGIFFEGWKPEAQPKKIETREDFVQAVNAELNNPNADPNQAVDAVFAVLRDHLTDGEIQGIQRSWPRDLQELWS